MSSSRDSKLWWTNAIQEVDKEIKTTIRNQSPLSLIQPVSSTHSVSYVSTSTIPPQRTQCRTNGFVLHKFLLPLTKFRSRCAAFWLSGHTEGGGTSTQYLHGWQTKLSLRVHHLIACNPSERSSFPTGHLLQELRALTYAEPFITFPISEDMLPSHRSRYSQW